jgi:NAD(P)-dependent dehydrogenase (short-subunit alcohol dehydrogenase family)
MAKFSNLENMKPEDYDEVMNVNLRSAILLTQYCLPHLTTTKGNIVNVSSVCGTRSFPNVLAYGVSKAGMDQFTKSAALELAPKSIRVNSVK